MRDGERHPASDPAVADGGASSATGAEPDPRGGTLPGPDPKANAGMLDTMPPAASALAAQPATPDANLVDTLPAAIAPVAQPVTPAATPAKPDTNLLDTLPAAVAPVAQPVTPATKPAAQPTTPATKPATPDAGLLQTMPAAPVAPAKPAAKANAAMLETMPAAPRPKSPTGGDTQPGPGVAAKRSPQAELLETMPAGTAPTPGATIGDTMTGTAAPPVIRPPSRNQATDETRDTEAPSGSTLPGPYTVADLPTLPRVDDETYAIGAEIARGGMGKILAARDRRLRREVVIKVMRREFGRIDPRFEREALITARLQHPSIVRVYDAGVLGDGRAFYAMERVRGRSLEVVLAETTTLADRLALLPHAIAVCDALAYAHNEGVVHRDLKPANILLGPFGETVVIDWGLAKDLNADEVEPGPVDPTEDTYEGTASNSALTQHGAVMGTPAFMAPEQARGEVADERTDVYALGALIYTMLTGAPPVMGTSSDEVIDAVATGKRKRIIEAEPRLPPELASIVERAMGHERDERYATAKALADDLRSFAAGKLVPSHAYSTWQLVRRWVARHRVSVGIGATAVVLLATLGVVAVRNIQSERDAATKQRGLAELAQFEAENKRDNLIFGQAQGVFRSDPSYAAGWLKHLSDRALGWNKTAMLAAELRAAGLAQVLDGHRQDIELVTASTDGEYVATGSDDSTVRLWNLETRGARELAGHTGPLDAMVMSSDSKYLATAGTDHKVILWTLADGSRRDLLGHTNTARGIAFSPDNSLLASTSEDGSMFIWSVATATGEKILQYTHSLRPIAWVTNTRVLVGSFDGKVGDVDVTTKKVAWYHEQGAELRSIAVSPNGKLWVTTDEDGQVILWDAATHKKIRTLTRHQDVAREAIITADSKYVVTAGGNDEVHVHSLPDGAFHALKGNEAGIKDIDMSAEGLIASAGIDGTVRVWKLDGTLLHTWRGHAAAVKGCAFVGAHVVSGAEDHRVRIWDLETPASAPQGPALRGWLEERTNLTGPETATTSVRGDD